MASKLSLFIAELKRRKVTRVAVVYALVGLGVIEGAQMILPTLQLEAAYNYIVIFVLFGFPIALVLAWALEVTPQGIQKTVNLTPEQLAAQTPNKWRASSWVLAGVGLVVVLGAVYFVFSRDRGPDTPGPRLAIMPFENRTPDAGLDVLGSMVSDKIAEGVSGSMLSDFFRVIPDQQVRSATSTNPDSSSSQAPLQLAEATGAGTVVSGWYYQEGESIRFQAEVTATDEGRVFATVQELGTFADQADAVESISDRVLGALLVHAATMSGDEFPLQGIPKYSAMLAYFQGEQAFGPNYPEAISHFDRAVELDSTFVEPRLRTVVAYVNLGERAAADSVLDLLAPYRDGLSIRNQLWFDQRRAQVRRNLMASLEIAQRQMEVDPEEFNPRYLAGINAVRVNRPEVAIEYLSPLAESEGDLWPALWGYLTAAHHMLGEHQEELGVARRGRELFPTSFGRLQDEVEALAALGHTEEVDRLLDESITFSESSPGTLMRITATEFLAHGYGKEARQLLDRALEWYENRSPSEKRSKNHRFNLARVLYAVERWEEAQSLIQELATEDNENIDYLGYIGVLAARLGDRAEAHRVSDRLAEMDDPYLGGLNTLWRANIASVLGERGRAVNLLREAHSEGSAFGIEWHRSLFLEPLRDYEPFEDFMRPKG